MIGLQSPKLKEMLDADYHVLSQATIDVFSRNKAVSDAAVRILQTIRAQALLSLRDHKERYRDYFDQYFLGKQP